MPDPKDKGKKGIWVTSENCPDPTKHNYYKKLMSLVRKEKIGAGEIHDVDIVHDDWCAIFSGRYCNCNPDIYHRKRQL